MSKKKIILISLFVLFDLLAIGVVFVIFRSNDILKAFKPRIEAEASSALGAPVSIGELSLSILSGDVEITSLRVGQSNSIPAFALDSLRLKVALGALLSGKLIVSEVTVNDPTLKFIKRKDGTVSDGAPKPPSSQQKNPTEQSSLPQSTPSSSPIDVNLDKIEVSNASIDFEDQSTGQTYKIRNGNALLKLTLSGNKVSIPSTSLSATLNDSLKISISGSNSTFDIGTSNLTLGTHLITLPGGELQVSGAYSLNDSRGGFSIKSSELKIAELLAAALPIAPTGLRELISAYNIKGSVGLENTISLALTESEKAKIVGPITLTKVNTVLPGAIRAENISSKIELDAAFSSNGIRGSANSTGVDLNLQGQPIKASFDAKMDGSELILSALQFAGFGGSGEISGGMTLSPEKPYSAKVRVGNLSLESLAAGFAPSMAGVVIGTINSFSTSVKGKLSGAVLQNVSGPGDLHLTNGAIRGINVAGQVLKAANQIPFLKNGLFGLVPPPLLAAVTSADTPVKDLKTSYTLNSGALALQSAFLTSDIFSLNSKGRITLPSALDLDATITFTKEFSDALASSIKDVKKMYSTEDQLVLPLSINGTPPLVIITPNLSEVLELAAKRILKDKAGEALDRAIESRIPGGKGVKDALGKVFGF